jgi:hypothetical protein
MGLPDFSLQVLLKANDFRHQKLFGIQSEIDLSASQFPKSFSESAI